jgi:hypothetical protein
LDNYNVVKNELGLKTTTQASEPVIEPTPVETKVQENRISDDSMARYPKSIGKFMVKRGQTEQQPMLSLEEMKKFED